MQLYQNGLKFKTRNTKYEQKCDAVGNLIYCNSTSRFKRNKNVYVFTKGHIFISIRIFTAVLSQEPKTGNYQMSIINGMAKS